MEIIKGLVGKFLGGPEGKKDIRTQILEVPMPTEIILKYIPKMLEDLKEYKGPRNALRDILKRQEEEKQGG